MDEVLSFACKQQLQTTNNTAKITIIHIINSRCGLKLSITFPTNGCISCSSSSPKISESILLPPFTTNLWPWPFAFVYASSHSFFSSSVRAFILHFFHFFLSLFMWICKYADWECVYAQSSMIIYHLLNECLSFLLGDGEQEKVRMAFKEKSCSEGHRVCKPGGSYTVIVYASPASIRVVPGIALWDKHWIQWSQFLSFLPLHRSMSSPFSPSISMNSSFGFEKSISWKTKSMLGCMHSFPMIWNVRNKKVSSWLAVLSMRIALDVPRSISGDILVT